MVVVVSIATIVVVALMVVVGLTVVMVVVVVVVVGLIVAVVVVACAGVKDILTSIDVNADAGIPGPVITPFSSVGGRPASTEKN